MEFLVPSLVGLALVDSMSVGTLLVPVWMMLAPGRPPTRPLMLYLGAIASFYLVVGVAVWSAAQVAWPVIVGVADSSAVRIVQLAVGIAVLVWSFRFDSKRRRRRGEVDRSHAWRDRVLSTGSAPTGVVTTALTAGVSEVMTMLPYLAAISMIVAAGHSIAVSAGLLALYCLIMVVPATLLLCVRTAAGNRVDGPLRRLDAVMSRHADSVIGWVLGLVGFLLAGNAVGALH